MLLILKGCASGYAPVSDRSIALDNKLELIRSSRREAVPATYRIKKGDTLYSIAWRYGLDYRQLARDNNIGNDFRINAGQKLRLKKSSTIKPAVNTRRSSSVKHIKSINKSISTSTAPPKNSNAGKIITAAPIKTIKKPPASKSVSSKNLVWRWPTQGKVISHYSNKGNINKGINLAGQRGEPVYAAASGKVVYSGSGLLGYGNLIIINHNQEYLSAYAHNSKIFVKENENINVGAKIAEIGNSGTMRTMLHFEIRKDGKPVNPLRYLPKR